MTKPHSFMRHVHGILLLDKPEGITSNAALQTVKRLYGAKKAGHTGSLDPLASGMLPVCFGEATKFSQFLLEADKTYQVTAKLGISTTTGDREGEIISKKTIPSDINQKKLQDLMKQFTGELSQIPSMYSALKHKGQPLYKLARQGIEIERQARKIVIYRIDLMDFDGESFTFTTQCSKGTYVRSLVEEMGEILNCGAHVTALRRLAVGDFQAQHMNTLPEIESLKSETHAFTQLDHLLLPIDSALHSWSAISVSEAAFYYLKQGQAIIAPQTTTGKWVRLIRKNGDFIGIGEMLDGGWLAPRRLMTQS